MMSIDTRLTVGLFVPCYIDQLFPNVGLATVELLKRLGVEIEFPTAQTCCGQPMANTGCNDAARPLARKFFEVFKGYRHVVCPSGSCVAMVRHHYEEYLADEPGFEELKSNTFELCEFIHDVLAIRRLDGRFPHRVGLHQSCHGLRELRLANSSELVGESYNKVRTLLVSLAGIELTSLQRPDECCGFGGTFAVSEEAVSCMMGLDRIHDHEQAGSEIITAADVSCLMHLDGLLRRRRKPIRVMHVAEILAEATRAWPVDQETGEMDHTTALFNR
jgi:L-lactate dehydrogenase complex protein LldE